MTKTQKIIYWISTVWLSLGMLSSAVVQLMKVEGEVEFIIELGYPAYVLTLLGVWKILGVIALLVPRNALVKEWAYAGFFFVTTGALFSHAAMASPFTEIMPSVLLLVLTITSWYFRPSERRLVFKNKIVNES